MPITEYVALAHLAAAKFWRRIRHGTDPQPLRIGKTDEETWHSKLATLWWGETSEIYENLFLGSAVNAASVGDMNLVVNVTEDVPNFYEGYGPKYIRVPMRDVPDAHFDPDEMKRTVDAVLEALADNKKVFVHCLFGASRSVAVVCACLMRLMDTDASAAYARVKETRPEVHMNVSFYNDLAGNNN